MPGSKSHANRALIAAVLASGRSELRHATPCDDVVHMVRGLQQLGFRLAWRDRAAGVVAVDGGIPRQPGASGTIDCGAAGTVFRFLTAVACVVPGVWHLTGADRLGERPIDGLVEALRGLGADISAGGSEALLRIRGGALRSGRVRLDGTASSQFATALQLIEPVLPGPLEIEWIGPRASPEYLDLTRLTRADFGAEDAGGGYQPRPDYAIEGDWSAFGAFLVLAELTGSRVVATNLRADSLQPDRRMPDVIADLRATGDLEIDVHAVPDQLMNLAVLAARRSGTTRFVGAANLRGKECDRLGVLVRELRKVGIDLESHDDGVVVRGGGEALRPARLDPEADHRMVMAFAVLASLQSGIEINDVGCVAKSYPDFLVDLKRLRRQSRCVALVGMRGSGKTTLGKALAERQGWSFVDTDAEIERRFGAIADMVDGAAGWAGFRAREAEVAGEALRASRRVVALGGGAIETDAVRNELARSATVIFVDTDEATLRARIAGSGRPSITGRDLVDEVAVVAAGRRPHYEGLAAVTVDGTTSIPEATADMVRGLKSLCRW